MRAMQHPSAREQSSGHRVPGVQGDAGGEAPGAGTGDSRALLRGVWQALSSRRRFDSAPGLPDREGGMSPITNRSARRSKGGSSTLADHRLFPLYGYKKYRSLCTGPGTASLAFLADCSYSRSIQYDCASRTTSPSSPAHGIRYTFPALQFRRSNPRSATCGEFL